MPAAAIRDGTIADLPRLQALLARSNDTPYDLVRVAEEKCFGFGIAGAPSVRMVEDAGVAVTCGKWLRILAVDRAARRRGIGSALLEDAESRGAHIVFAEPGNYFTPGVLASDEATLAFFHARGYREKGQTWNLRGGAAGPAASRRLPAGEVRRLEAGATRASGPRHLEFIEREFGRIWRFEASRARALFVTEEKGTITGFAAVEANNRGLGTFGPTGVAKSHRGKGLGTQLLLAALAELHALGYEQVTIPWTDALDFYRKACGAEPAHQFVGLDSAP